MSSVGACDDINVESEQEDGVQICIPDVVRCSAAGNEVELCAGDGRSFLFAAQCKREEKCDAGSCVLPDGTASCKVGWKRCSPDDKVVQVCTPNGSWVVDTECTKGCSGGHCK